MMNAAYPKCTSDYDGNFVGYLLDTVFERAMLRAVGDSGSLRTFPSDQLRFVKSIDCYWFFFKISTIYTMAFVVY